MWGGGGGSGGVTTSSAEDIYLQLPNFIVHSEMYFNLLLRYRFSEYILSLVFIAVMIMITLNHYIALFFNCMLVHGVVPENFRVSILVPIPKGPRVDARNSDNHRAVALNSVLGKILDNIIVCTIEESLATSNQQFGYKANLSTIMCSSLVIETIHYFESKCSPTCVLFIDVFKAFDRVRYIDLFNVLSKRNMCALVRRYSPQ